MRGGLAVIAPFGSAVGHAPLIRPSGTFPRGRLILFLRRFSSNIQIPIQIGEKRVAVFLLCFLVLHDIGTDLAVQNRHNAVGTFGQFRLMRDHNKRYMAGFGHFQHPVQHLLARAGIQVAGGFVGKMTLGLLTNARAMPTRCCWPPLISVGRWLARPKSPMAFSSLRALVRRVFCPRP